MVDVAVQAQLFGATGSVALEDYDRGYQIEASTREERAISRRRITVDNPWVEGSYTISSVRENVTEPVNVWVQGTSHTQMDNRRKALTDILEEDSYTLQWAIGDLVETWHCQASDYAIRSQKEYNFATICLVKAQIIRLPKVTRIV